MCLILLNTNREVAFKTLRSVTEKMKKKYYSAIWLLSAIGMASSGVSTSVLASVSASQEIVGAKNSQQTSPVTRNPFRTEDSMLTVTSSGALVLKENELLSQGIESWAVGHGYKLFWNSKKDYLVYNTINLPGKTDDDVLQSLGDLFFSENYGLVVKKYEKNHVIVVDEM